MATRKRRAVSTIHRSRKDGVYESKGTASVKRIYYAGIGARKTPLKVIHQMSDLGAALAGSGWVLRSGGADGADAAFERGADSQGGYTQVFRVNPVAEIESPNQWDRVKCLTTVTQFHPAPGSLSTFVKLLMARNAAQVLGGDLLNQSSFVLFWASGSKRDRDGIIYDCNGGTGQAIRIAYHHRVPVFNLYDDGAVDYVLQHSFKLQEDAQRNQDMCAKADS